MKAFLWKVWDLAKKPFEFFENDDGSFSSRRLAGSALIVVGVVGWFQGKDMVLAGVVIGLGATLLGLTTADDRALR